MPVDSDFADAVRRAAIGNPNKLVAYLNDSKRTVGDAERKWLANLVVGQFNRPAGSPPVGPGNQNVVRAVASYRLLKETYGRGGEEAAARKASEEAGCSMSTIRNWDKQTREREALCDFPK